MIARTKVDLTGRKGLVTAYLATDAAKLFTGQTFYIDDGYNILD